MKRKIIIFSILIMLVCSYLMANNQLWTWYPLPFFLAFWTIIFTLKSNKFDRIDQGKLIVLSTITGIWLSIGFPGITGFAPILFISLVPIFYIHNYLQKQKASLREYWFYIYHALVIWNIITTWWVANSVLAPSFIAIFLNSFFMSLPWLVFWKINQSKKINSFLKLYSILPFWLIFEYIHLRWEISWPWLTLGNSWSSYFPFVQWYQYTGVHGGTIWIFLINILVYKLLEINNFEFNSQIFFRKTLKKYWIAISVVLFIPLLLSIYLYLKPDPTSSQSASVIIVQPNFEPHYEKFSLPEEFQVQRFMELIDQKIDGKTDYIVCPETSFENVNEYEIGMNNTFVDWQNYFSKYPNCCLISGIGSFKFLKPEEPTTRSTRIPKQNPNRRWEAYNAAVQFQQNKYEPFKFYHKSRFVPGAEIMPYPFLFGFLQPMFDKFGGSMEGYGSQSDRSVFTNPKNYKIAPAICFESIYGNFMRGFYQNGANAIFIMTNDGWWNNTPGYLQHHEFARLRAIESHRWIARSANTGISSFIDTKGNSYQETNYNEMTVIKQTIPLYDDKTIYSRFGDWIVYLFVGSFFVLFLLNLFFYKNIK